MSHIRLSIVIPCYNVEKTLGRALDSILMQRVDFAYEIIAVNDFSSDGTGGILREYAAKDRRIMILDNDSNLGNAKTFRKAAKASRGDYLCVLDGDDFYTVRDKLQRQVDFLDGDKDGKYAAVAHKYLTVHEDGAIKEDMRLFEPARDYSYLDFLTQHFYCHTSTMMYRNVFRGMDIPILETQRGDTIRTLIAAGAICGRVKILNFVGSAYTVNPKGIWSSLDAADKKKINVGAWKSCQRHVESAREKRIIGTVVKRMASREPREDNKKSWAIDSLLEFTATRMANNVAFRERDFIFRKLYKSDFIDSFSESLGYVMKVFLDLPLAAAPDPKSVAIVISALNKTGGGVYQEILELAAMLQGKRITILLTGMSGIDEFTEAMKNDFAPLRNLSFIFLNDAAPHRLAALQTKLSDLAPGRIYWYCGHNNTLADAALQSYGGLNIVPFSFDHGLSLGLANSNIDLIIAKTPKDYKLLAQKFGERVIYIPCWSVPARTERKYSPPAGPLATATAAARFYKYQGDILGNFVNFVVYLMKTTGGRHIHYGPLPPEVVSRLENVMQRNGIAPERFTHVEWADNLPDAMLAQGVNLFIAPFPISSIKINLQCMSAGIPVLVYAGGLTRIEQNDFLYPDALSWRNRKEFFDVIRNLSAKKLLELSVSGLAWFRSHNDLAAAMPHVLQNRCFAPVPIPPGFLDDKIIDTEEIIDLISFVYED